MFPTASTFDSCTCTYKIDPNIVIKLLMRIKTQTSAVQLDCFKKALALDLVMSID